MIDNRSLQHAMKVSGFYHGPLDGAFGSGSRAAALAFLLANKVPAAEWPHSRRMIALNQLVMAKANIPVGKIDGLVGPSTIYALELWQDRLRDELVDEARVAHLPETFPRQADMLEFYGKPGTGHTKLKLPYPFRLAWDTSQEIDAIRINAKCAASAERALGKALEHYGHAKLRELGLDLFGGCYANRSMRGGRSLSTHAFAAALDFDPEHNQLRWGSDRARMAGPKYAAFLDAFEAEGWVSLGRERNFDWMHIQAARL